MIAPRGRPLGSRNKTPRLSQAKDEDEHSRMRASLACIVAGPKDPAMIALGVDFTAPAFLWAQGLAKATLESMREGK